MTKRADKIEPGDVLEGYGRVLSARLHRYDDKAPPSYTGMARRPTRTVCPPVRIKAKVVELRTDGHPVPVYRWPSEKLEMAA